MKLYGETWSRTASLLSKSREYFLLSFLVPVLNFYWQLASFKARGISDLLEHRTKPACKPGSPLPVPGTLGAQLFPGALCRRRAGWGWSSPLGPDKYGAREGYRAEPWTLSGPPPASDHHHVLLLRSTWWRFAFRRREVLWLRKWFSLQESGVGEAGWLPVNLQNRGANWFCGG